MVRVVVIGSIAGTRITCVVESGYEMACYHPITVDVPHGDGPWKRRIPTVVGCGSCIGCRSDQAREWMIRIKHEAALHPISSFITLTYNDEEIPENGSLRATDLQKFFKTLRRRLEPARVRYFACGEYGGETKRPHYHAVLFGPHFLDRVPLTPRNGYPVWRSPTLEAAWSRGFTELGTLTTQSAAYVAGYVQEKLKGREADESPFFVDHWTGEVLREQQFSRMSLKPAIARRWIEKYWRSVYQSDEVHIDGNCYRPPRYYDKWMEQEHKPYRVQHLLPDGTVELEVRECKSCKEHQDAIRDVKAQRYEWEGFDRYTLCAKEAEHKSRKDLFQSRVGL